MLHTPPPYEGYVLITKGHKVPIYLHSVFKGATLNSLCLRFYKVKLNP